MPLVNSAGARTARLKYCITHSTSACCDTTTTTTTPPLTEDGPGRTGNTGPYGPVGPRGAGSTGPDGVTGSFPLQRYSDYNYGITGYIDSVPPYPGAYVPVLNSCIPTDICFPFYTVRTGNGLFQQPIANRVINFDKVPAMKLNFTRPSTPSDSFACDINFTLTLTSLVNTGIPSYSDHATNHVSMYARLVNDPDEDGNVTSLHGLAADGSPLSNPDDQVMCVRRFNLMDTRLAPFTSLVTAKIPNPDPPGPPGEHTVQLQGPALYTYDFVKSAKNVANRLCHSFPVMLRLNCYYTVAPGERQPVNLQLLLMEELRPSGQNAGLFGYVTNMVTGFNPVRAGNDGVVTNITAFSF